LFLVGCRWERDLDRCGIGRAGGGWDCVFRGGIVAIDFSQGEVKFVSFSDFEEGIPTYATKEGSTFPN
jgi:hypothetical protein